MSFALWSTDTNNLVAEFDHQEDALRIVRESIARGGVDAIRSISLDVEDEHGDISPIAHGSALAALAPRQTTFTSSTAAN